MSPILYEITKQLFLSRLVGPPHFDALVNQGITAVVNLEPDHVFESDPRLRYLFEGVLDWRPIPHEALDRIYTFIDEEIVKGKVLVHCFSGKSRSGGVVVGWLMLQNPDWTWETAVDFVRKARNIRPAPGIEEGIRKYVEAHRRNS